MVLDQRSADGMAKLHFREQEAEKARSVQKTVTEGAFQHIEASGKMHMDTCEG